MRDRAPSPTERGLRWFVALALAVAAIATLLHVHRFAMERFFTVDEYHYGHATWLVAQGHTPYRDFYEHHFPLSYVLHAPLLPTDASFVEGALRLRSIAFAYLALVCALLAATSFVATRPASVGSSSWTSAHRCSSLHSRPWRHWVASRIFRKTR